MGDFVLFVDWGRRIGSDTYNYSRAVCGISYELENGVAGQKVATITIAACKVNADLWAKMVCHENDRDIVLISHDNRGVDMRLRNKTNLGGSLTVYGACELCGEEFRSMLDYNKHLKNKHRHMLVTLDAPLKDVVVVVLALRLTIRFQLNEYKRSYLTSNNVQSAINESNNLVMPRPWFTDVGANMYLADREEELKEARRNVNVLLAVCWKNISAVSQQ